MEGILNVLNFLKENWTAIVIIIALVYAAYGLFQKLQNMSSEERKAAILQIVKSLVLKLMSDAEVNWSDISKAGKIKSAEVIERIYLQYPQLARFKDQEELIASIQKIIDDKMEELREIMRKQAEEIEGDADDVISDSTIKDIAKVMSVPADIKTSPIVTENNISEAPVDPIPELKSDSVTVSINSDGKAQVL